MRLAPLAVAVLAACSAPPPAPRAESDEQPVRDVPGLGRVRELVAMDATRALIVDEDARLFLVQRNTRRLLLDNVVGAPALVPDDRVIAARTTEPGESDLWIIDGVSPPRALSAERGADAQPFVLADGRVLFVSDRTGVASVFVIGLDGAGLAQLTNRGEVPGQLSSRFAPPPLRWLAQEDGRVKYDAGDSIWILDANHGGAEVAR